MSDRSGGAAAAEWHRHWTVVAAATAGMALSAIPVYSTGVMIAPIEQEFGWSRVQISSGLTILSVASIAFSTFIGLSIDRVGARRIGIAAAVLMCAAIALLSRATPNIVSWWAAWCLIGLASAAMPTVWTAAVSSLFFKGRGLALAVTLCGTGLGATLVPMAANYFVENHGWRSAYLGMVGFWAIVGLPLIFLFFRGATDKQQTAARKADAAAPATQPGLTAREGFASAAFLKLASASFAITVAGVAMVVNLVPILSSSGLPRSTAAAIAGLIGVSNIVGRLIGGYLMDRISASAIAAGTTIATGVFAALLLAMPGSVPVAVTAVVVLGLAVGAKFGAIVYLASRHFGPRSFGILFGAISSLFGLGVGVGPLLANYAYDRTQSYDLVLWAVLPVFLLAVILFLRMGPYPDFSAREAAGRS